MRFGIALLMLSFVSPIAGAAQQNPVETIGLQQVILKVLQDNPRLKANDLQAQAMATRIKQARQSHPYQLSLALENFAGTGAFKGDEALESTLSLSRVLELGNRPELRGNVAEVETSLLSSQQDAARLDLLAEATRRFVHVIVDQQKLAIAQDKQQLMQRTHTIVQQRVKAGRSPLAERRRAAIELARAEIELEHSEHELATSRLKLSSLWGETSPAFGRAEAELFQMPTAAGFESLVAQLQANPDIVRLATRQRLSEARLQLAQAKSSGELTLRAGIKRFSNSSDNALVFSASIPLGSGSRANPYIEEAKLQGQREPFDYQQRYLELYTSLFEVYQELLHAKTALNSLQGTIIPEAKQALRDYEQGYRAGRYSLLELSDAQNTLLSARLETVNTAAKYHRYQIEIERLTGASLPTVKPTGATQ